MNNEIKLMGFPLAFRQPVNPVFKVSGSPVLPTDILGQIFAYIPLDLIQKGVQQVCRHWHFVANQDFLWRQSINSIRNRTLSLELESKFSRKEVFLEALYAKKLFSQLPQVKQLPTKTTLYQKCYTGGFDNQEEYFSLGTGLACFNQYTGEQLFFIDNNNSRFVFCQRVSMINIATLNNDGELFMWEMVSSKDKNLLDEQPEQFQASSLWNKALFDGGNFSIEGVFLYESRLCVYGKTKVANPKSYLIYSSLSEEGKIRHIEIDPNDCFTTNGQMLFRLNIEYKATLSCCTLKKAQLVINWKIDLGPNDSRKLLELISNDRFVVLYYIEKCAGTHCQIARIFDVKFGIEVLQITIPINCAFTGSPTRFIHLFHDYITCVTQQGIVLYHIPTGIQVAKYDNSCFDLLHMAVLGNNVYATIKKIEGTGTREPFFGWKTYRLIWPIKLRGDLVVINEQSAIISKAISLYQLGRKKSLSVFVFEGIVKIAQSAVETLSYMLK